MKLSRTISFLKAALLAAIAAPIFIQPAYSQQEVAPGWYNPWPDAPKPAAKPTPTKIATHKNAKATLKDHTSATQAKKKQPRAQEPLRAAAAPPPFKK